MDDEAYLLTVIRYIHQNPVKAGLCQSASSYGAYIKGAGITDRGFTLELMDREAFVAFNEAANDDRRLDESAPPLPRLSDDAAMELLKRSLRCDSAAARRFVRRAI